MLNQQLDMDGGRHDIAPATERLSLFDSAPQMKGQTAMDTDRAERCSDCGAPLTDGTAFHPYGDCYASRCKDCDAAAWARLDAMTAARGGCSTAANNVWD